MAKIDTDSSHCIFERKHGQQLELWLDRVKLGLIEQEGKLFLSKYRKDKV